uniref:Uncharacterized protein n=1 Tax=Megaselia scalaris TaxID=36166 RepID=T1H180_MEGSC
MQEIIWSEELEWGAGYYAESRRNYFNNSINNQLGITMPYPNCRETPNFPRAYLISETMKDKGLFKNIHYFSEFLKNMYELFLYLNIGNIQNQNSNVPIVSKESSKQIGNKTMDLDWVNKNRCMPCFTEHVIYFLSMFDDGFGVRATYILYHDILGCCKAY